MKDSSEDHGALFQTNDKRISIIKRFYPAYFRPSRLEVICDLNTSYIKWIEDYNITREWIGDFPSIEIYHSYIRYCVEHRYNIVMDKRLFFHVLERDFNIVA